MCLDLLLPRPSGGGLQWSVTHCGFRPGRYALLCLGVLVLWVQLGVLANRGCWGRDSLGLAKILSASYFCTVLWLGWSGGLGYAVVFYIGKGFCCVWGEVRLIGILVCFFFLSCDLVVRRFVFPMFIDIGVRGLGFLSIFQGGWFSGEGGRVRRERKGEWVLVSRLLNLFTILSVLGFWFGVSGFEGGYMY